MTHFIGRYAVISGILFLILCPNFCLGLCALEHGGERPRLLCTEDSATVDSLPQEEGEEASKLPKYLAPIAVGVVASLGSPIIAPALLGAAGFAAAGVVAGSVTAAIQSTFYGGTTCGLFAVAQSAGAAGISSLTAAAAGATATVTTAVFQNAPTSDVKAPASHCGSNNTSN